MSSPDDSNFDQAFDELINSPKKGSSANRRSLNGSGKRSSSKNSASGKSVSEFLLSSSDSFSSPQKSPKPPQSVNQLSKGRPNIGRGTFYTGLDQDTEDQSGSYSIFSESVGESAYRPSVTPDIGLKKGSIAAPSPVSAGNRGGSDSDFDLEDSVLGNLIGENSRTRRSMTRPTSSSATSTVRNSSPDVTVRKDTKSLDEPTNDIAFGNRPTTTGSIESRGKMLGLDMLSGIYGNKDQIEHSFPDKMVPANTPAAAVRVASAPMNTPSNLQRSTGKQMTYPSDDEVYQVSSIPGLISRNSSGRNSPSLGLFEPVPVYENLYPVGSSTPVAAGNQSSIPVAAADQLLITPVNNQTVVKKDRDDVDMGFVPSFLDPDRKSRSRR